MSTPEFDVVIVGAGIAGGALARALVDRGLRLALVEARPLLTEQPPTEPGVAGFDPRVSSITPASRALFERLGAWQRVLDARACAYTHMTVWDAEGTGEISFDATELDVPCLGHIVENRVLTSALLSGLENADLHCVSPARLENLEHRGDGSVRLELDGGRSLTTRLLVAADGALSHTRELAGFATREWDYGHRALVMSVRTELPHADTAYQRFMPTGPLAFLPLPGTHYCSIVWSAEPALADELLAMSDPDFCDALSAALEHRLGTVLECSARSAFPLRQRHAVDYVKEGVALVGDAAHTIHPLAGQGINLGLQDVEALADELLRGLDRGDRLGDLNLLRRYQRRRKGDNLLMMAAMDGFKQLFGQRSLPVRWLRNTGMRLVGQATPLKHQIMRHAMGIR